MRLAVVGSRDFNDYRVLCAVLDQIREAFNITAIISGGAKGADSLAEKYAYERDIKLEIHLADWENKGKGAGFIRNAEIWDNADMGVAFWDGRSKGTAHSFKLAEKQNKPLYVFNYKRDDFYLQTPWFEQVK